MTKNLAVRTVLLMLMASSPVLAATDATVSQVYEATRSGHIAEAEQMINQVLHDYPGSARAHYVAAEVYARGGDFPTARRELAAAQRLSPGLAFARPDSVAALERELTRGVAPVYGSPAARTPAIPWGLVILVVAGVAVLWAVMRRRQASIYSPYPSALPPAAGVGAPPLGGPGLGGGGLMGSLATGLAVGAGVAAGEELVRHVVGGDHEGGFVPAAEAGEGSENQNLGGTDFGVTDGQGWDDGGSFGGDVSGNDWT